MKKFIAAILIIQILLINPLQSEAIAPALVAGGLVLGTALIVGGAMTVYKPPGYNGPSAFVSPTTKTVGALAYATQNMLNQYGQNQLWGALLTAKMTLDDLRQLTGLNPAKYPQLNDAFTKKEDWLAASLNIDNCRGVKVNDIIKTANGSYYKVTSSYDYQVLSYQNIGAPTAPSMWFPYRYNGSNVTGAYMILVDKNNPVTNPADRPRSDADAVAKLAPPAIPADANPAKAISDIYSGEIDDFIRSNPNVVTFADTANPGVDLDNAPPITPPFPLPGTVPGTTVTGLGAETATAAATNAANAQTALTQAQAAQAAAQTAYDANPTAENQEALDAATAAAIAAAAKAAAAAAAATQAQIDQETAYPNANGDGLKSLKWDRWKDLLNLMKETFPFTLLLAIAGYLELFVGPSTAPVFEFPLAGNTLHVNLSMFDPVAACLRYGIAIILSIAIIQYLVEWFRGK